MDLNDPIVIALLKVYAKHYRFFYNLYDGKFRVLVNWLTDDRSGYKRIHSPSDEDIPWYCRSAGLYHMAEILKVSPGELYKKLKELEEEKK